jgi:hypothetical protein
MKTVNIEGISFTEESLVFLKEWLGPKTDNPDIFYDVEAIEKKHSFIINLWSDSCYQIKDPQIKELLICLQCTKENLSQLLKGTKGGEA